MVLVCQGFHLGPYALRCCNILVTWPHVIIATTCQSRGIPVNTICDLCAAWAAWEGGGGLYRGSELVYGAGDATRFSSGRAPPCVQKSRRGAP